MTAERADNSPKWILRRTVKAALAGALCAAGVRWVVRGMRRRQAGGARVLILSYHRVSLDFASDAVESLPSLLVSADTLHRQLSQLARGYDVVSLGDACRILAEPAAGRPSAARDVAVVTFDDGYVGVHAHALPVLRELRMPATVFMATGFAGTARRLLHDRLWGALTALWRRRIPPAAAALPAPEQAMLESCAGPGPAVTLDRLISRLTHDELAAVTGALEARLGVSEDDLPDESRLMTWEELRELEANGIAVGGHTVHHAVLANLPLSRARAEVKGCFDQIAEHLGHPPRHFAYPNGYHTPAVRRLVAEVGFEAAVTTEDAENRRGADRFSLRRKVLWENSTLGLSGYSAALATCNIEGVFGALGWQRPVLGERPDAPGELAAEPERAAV